MGVLRWVCGLALTTTACSSSDLPEGSSADSLASGTESASTTDESDSLTTGITMSSGPGSSGSLTSSSTGLDPSETEAGTDTAGGCSGNDDCPEADGDLCTWPRCDDNACTETAADCDPAGNQCALGSCNPDSGACEYVGDDATCEANVCTMGICELEVDGDGEFVSATCTSQARDGIDCDDEDACTSDDVCGNGICGGAPMLCDDVPATGCSGATLEVYSGPGACMDGECEYMLESVECPDGCASATCNPPTHAVISEFLYNDDGNDSNVWIELWVPGGTDLGTLSLDFVNGSNGTPSSPFALSGATPGDNLVLIIDPAADDAALIAAADFVDGFADLQNGPDTVRLRENDVIIDAVAYGTFGAGETAAGEGTPAPGAAVDESLARRLTFVDSDDNATDFARDDTPTPGALND